MEANPAEWSTSKAYHVITSVVAPRPIAWVSSLNDDGSVNAAPFSWFQAICADPPLVMIAFGDRDDGTLKDTPRNIRARREFVVNTVTKDFVERAVATSAPLPPGASEVEAVGLGTVPSQTIKTPRLDAAIAHLECKFIEEKRYGGAKGTTVIVGEVVHVHLDDAFTDERGSLRANAGLVGRLGGTSYVAATSDSVFDVRRPPA